MGLKVWLPLDGNLENKGTSNVTIENMGAVTTNAAGKIGSCMAFTGTETSYLRIPAILSNTDCSIAFWAKLNSSSTAHTFYSQRVINNTTGFTIFQLSSGNLRFDDGGSFEVAGIGTGTWHHVVCCRDATKKYIYVDGELRGSSSKNNANPNVNYALIGGSQNNAAGTPSQGTTNALNGYLNDYRIYDHCLSAAEVKEISQGLVLHYKLDNPVESTTNLVPNPLTFSNWIVYQNGYTSLNNSRLGGKSIIITNKGTWCGMYSPTITLPSTGTYTLSVYCKPIARSSTSVNQTLYTTGGGLSDQHVSASWDNPGQWQRLTMTKTFTTTSITLYLIAYGGTKGTDTVSCEYTLPQIEAKDHVTSFTESSRNIITIQDSGGYGHNGTIVGSPILSSNSARHSVSTYLADGTVSRIVTPSLSFEPHAVTLNIWFKSTNTSPTGTYHMVVDSNANRQWYEMAVYNTGYFRGGLFVNGARKADNGTSTKCLDGNWHMLTLTYDGTNVNRYVDGVMEKATAAAYSSGLSTPTALTIGRDGPNASYAVKEASLSDFRIYCTALSEEDILTLYHTNTRVGDGSIQAYEYQETSPNIIINNNGIINESMISELNILKKLQYDSNIYIEPDGSAWVRIFHHNNPASYLFESNNSFTTGVYIDENRWFNFDMCDDVSSWEFMVKGKYTVSNNEWKIRWIQPNNPMTATFANVAAANIIKITTDGYGVTPSSYGGLYKRTYDSTKTYLCCNNGTESNWYGAVGCWSAYQGGIPGWFSGNTATVTTTGYNDIYLRIDNLTLSNIENVSFKQSGAILAHQIIES